MNGFYLEFTSPKEEAATAITPSQPSREVERQDAPEPLAVGPMLLMALVLCIAAGIGASVLAKSIANVAHYNAHHIDRGAY